MNQKKEGAKTIAMVVSALVMVLAAVVVILLTVRGMENKRKAQLDLANRYLEEMNCEQAIAAYERVIENDPNCTEAYFGLAEAYAALGEPERALEILDEGYDRTQDGRFSDRMEQLQEEQARLTAEGGAENTVSTEYGGADGATDTGAPNLEGDQEPDENDRAQVDSLSADSDPQDEPSGEGSADAADASAGVPAGTITVQFDYISVMCPPEELEFGWEGTLPDGSGVTEEDIQVRYTYIEERGIITAEIYRTDGSYVLELGDGIGWIEGPMERLPGDDEIRITVTTADGIEHELRREDCMYRAYTGYWTIRVSIENGEIIQ